MALPTSDLHNPTVCIGGHIRSITNDLSPPMRGASVSGVSAAAALEFNTMKLPLETPLRMTALGHPDSNYSQANNHSNNLMNNNNISGDLASVDSSDTYASCQTHPFLSQGDLTGEIADISHTLDELDMSDLYFASLERNRPTIPIAMGSTDVKSHVKKSASGDVSLHSLGATPLHDDAFATFQSFEMASRTDHGSHASLNDPPMPKHRKTRFQQGSLNKTKSLRVDPTTSKKLSHDSLSEHSTPSTSSTGKKNRRASFMPTKSLASATKLINQHLFGIQHSASKGTVGSVWFETRISNDFTILLTCFS